jgi:BlaI family transcriptional regulator, penicillinase repressor
MVFIWSAGPSTAVSCRAALSPGRSVRYSSVRIGLRRLEQKGLLKHHLGPDEQTFIFESAQPHGHFLARVAQNIIDRFCGGSVEQLLLGMVENKVLKQKDLEHLARSLASQQAEKK